MRRPGWCSDLGFPPGESHMEKLGSFQRIEDLMNVRGIGERKFLQLQDLIKVDGPAPGR